MSEFTKGIIESIKNVIGYSSVTLAIIFFIGHVIIAMTVVSMITKVVTKWYNYNF